MMNFGRKKYLRLKVEAVQSVLDACAVRMSETACLECGAPIEPYSPPFVDHTRACPGAARMAAVLKALEQ